MDGKNISTLYKPRQKAEGLLVVPSNIFSKLCGFSIFILPLKATKPVPTTMRSTRIFRTPRRFWRRKPHLSAVPWMMKADVIHPKPTKRSVHRPGSMSKALRMYSPKTMEFPALQAIVIMNKEGTIIEKSGHVPRRTACAAYMDVMRYLGLRKRYSK